MLSPRNPIFSHFMSPGDTWLNFNSIIPASGTCLTSFSLSLGLLPSLYFFQVHAFLVSECVCHKQQLSLTIWMYMYLCFGIPSLSSLPHSRLPTKLCRCILTFIPPFMANLC